MGPRKRSRPNPKVEAPPKAPQNVVVGLGVQATVPSNTGEHIEHASSGSGVATSIPNPSLQDGSSTKSHSSLAWFGSGSWPRVQKASPSTKVARETILADKPKNALSSADFSRFESRKADATVPASSLSSSSLGGGEAEEGQCLMSAESSTKAQRVAVTEEGTDGHSNVTNNSKKPSDLSTFGAQRQVTTPGWLDWFGLSYLERKADSEPLQSQILPGGNGTIPSNSIYQQSTQSSPVDPSISEQTAPSKSNGENPTIVPVPTSSWFTIWPGLASNKKTIDTFAIESRPITAPEVPVAEAMTGVQSKRPLPGSTWAFWSRDSQRPAEKGGDAEEQGELAVTGEESQDSPAPAHAAILGGDKDNKVTKSNKRGRQMPDDVQKPASKASDSDSSNKKRVSQAISAVAPDSSAKATPSQIPVPSKSISTNLVLPSFRSTYHLVENPSIIQQIARLLMHSQQPANNHVYLTKDPPKIRKAIAIGIHGLFPAALLRTVIGQPTGTSIRFANHAAAAIHRWATAHGYSCEIEKVALEGEGKIAERVDNLWKLLLNWIDHVRSADVIIVACHSQGVPVALMLVAKLIEFGVVTTSRVGVCAMAGVSLGPFADYKSRLFSGSAAELFEFANQNSEVSKRYESSLRVALKYGARVSFFGSIDDQLVSLESAIFAPIDHPYIYRAVFVDGRVHAPDFIAHLVGFALKLRNLGVSDHGIIRELSVPLAGSLYTGEGHSRLYDELKIYDDAVSFTLETNSIGDVPLHIQKFEIPTNTNPFQLPWSMRGLLEEDIVKTELDQETAELLNQFDEWKPTTKVLKDVKYRLEAVKSKL